MMMFWKSYRENNVESASETKENIIVKVVLNIEKLGYDYIGVTLPESEVNGSACCTKKNLNAESNNINEFSVVESSMNSQNSLKILNLTLTL
jgi:hypothetical protein